MAEKSMLNTQENMRYYSYWNEVPKDAQKQILAGRLKGMTDINPMWRIKMLTEMFGPCGVGWWYDIVDKRIVDDEITHQKSVFFDIMLYYIDRITGEQSHGVFGTGGASFVANERSGPYLSDECFKMALTDALSVACKELGIGANTYWQKDSSKYESYYDAPGTPNSVTRPVANPAPVAATQTTPAPAPAPKSPSTAASFEAEPAEVGKELLEELCTFIRGPKETRSVEADKEFAALIKSINNGKPNYKTIEDADIRKAVYVALYKKYISKED